jgi:hypothetical protein
MSKVNEKRSNGKAGAKASVAPNTDPNTAPSADSGLESNDKPVPAHRDIERDIDPDEICGARTGRDGSKAICYNPAGMGTWHPGEGRCYIHGGNQQTERNGKLLRVAANHPELSQRATEIMNSDNQLMSFKQELALLKARFEKMDVMLEEDADVPELRRMTRAIADVTRSLLEMEKAKDNWVHLSIVTQMVAAFSQVGQKYIKDVERRRRFVEEVEDVIVQNMRKNTAAATTIAARAISPGNDLEVSKEW